MSGSTKYNRISWFVTSSRYVRTGPQLTIAYRKAPLRVPEQPPNSDVLSTATQKWLANLYSKRSGVTFKGFELTTNSPLIETSVDGETPKLTFTGWSNELNISFWYILILSALPLLPYLFVLKRHLRRRRRLRRHLCPYCGFDLRASPDRCPECGESTPNFPLFKPMSLARRLLLEAMITSALTFLVVLAILLHWLSVHQ